jgi:hypothetical protein
LFCFALGIVVCFAFGVVVICLIYIALEQNGITSNFLTAIFTGILCLGVFFQWRTLDSQREQFNAQFQYLKDAREREAEREAREILSQGKEQLFKKSGVSSFDEFGIKICDYEKKLETVLVSDSEHFIIERYDFWEENVEWVIKEFFKYVKAAAIVYFRSVNKINLDEKANELAFYYKYRQDLRYVPPFLIYNEFTFEVTEFLSKYTSIRKQALLAYDLAISLTNKSLTSEIISKFQPRFHECRCKGYELPKLVEIFVKKNNLRID